MNSLVFRIVTTSKSPYSVLLGLSRDTYYLYLFIMTIYLELPKSNKVYVNIVDLASHSNTF